MNIHNIIIAANKRGIHIIFFLFLHKKIHCGYLSEASPRSTSKKYPHICFHGGIRNLSLLFISVEKKKYFFCSYVMYMRRNKKKSRAHLFKTNDVIS